MKINELDPNSEIQEKSNNQISQEKAQKINAEIMLRVKTKIVDQIC